MKRTLSIARLIGAEKADLAEDALDDFKCDDNDVQPYDLLEAKSVCLVHAAILQEIATGVPTLPDRVFRTLRDFQNIRKDNPPHTEGLYHALKIATGSMGEALELSYRLDGNEVDDMYHLIMSIAHSVSAQADRMASAISTWHSKEVRAAILAGESISAIVQEQLSATRERWPGHPDVAKLEAVLA